MISTYIFHAQTAELFFKRVNGRQVTDPVSYFNVHPKNHACVIVKENECAKHEIQKHFGSTHWSRFLS